jgi:hypothetical protein
MTAAQCQDMCKNTSMPQQYSLNRGAHWGTSCVALLWVRKGSMIGLASELHGSPQAEGPGGSYSKSVSVEMAICSTLIALVNIPASSGRARAPEHWGTMESASW